jgi:hypothetical protein
MPIRPLFAVALSLAAHAAIASDAPVARYTLRYDPHDATMAVRVCSDAATSELHLRGDRGASSVIDAMHRDGAQAPERDGDRWTARDWRSGDCIDYRAALGKLSDAKRDNDLAKRGDTITLDPGGWLLRVDGDGAWDEARVELPPGYSIAAPWHPLPADGKALRFRIPRTPADWISRVAIGRFATTSVAVADGTLRVAILGDVDAAERSKLEAWIARAGHAPETAYGKFPLADASILIAPIRDRSARAVVFGESTRGQGHTLTLLLDPTRSAADLDADWVAVHELSHTFHPYLDDRGSWLAEGLATYYQNVLRARAGLLSPAQAWEQLDAGFERGRSSTGAHEDTLDAVASAIDRRPEFGRIYWSGTAFWLETDLALRRASNDTLGVDEALRRFDACCLPDQHGWTPEDFVAKLDALIGSEVFRRNFTTYSKRTDFPDLKATYAALGIARVGDALHYDDAAPAAGVRRAIMAPPAAR